MKTTITTTKNLRNFRIKLSLPYSEVVQKYFQVTRFFCFCSQIMTTNPASSPVCLLVLTQTQVVLSSF